MILLQAEREVRGFYSCMTTAFKRTAPCWVFWVLAKNRNKI